MKDWSFLFNKYIRHVKKDDGLSWDFPSYGMLIDHDEDFLNDTILSKGDVFVDVGANVGAWSIRASPYYSSVESFEPNPRFFHSLRRNKTLNKCKNIRPYNLALSNYEGLTTQAVLAPSTPELPMRNASVRTTRLDDLHLSPSILKVDVEGEALNVVSGSMQTILTNHPRIIVEVHSKEESLVPSLLPSYTWGKQYRPMPHTGDWLYREDENQVFLIGVSQ